MLAKSGSGWAFMLQDSHGLISMHVTHYTILFFCNARLVLMKRRSRAENSAFRKKSVVLSLPSGGRPRISCSLAYSAANANHNRCRLSFCFVNDWAPPFRFPD